MTHTRLEPELIESLRVATREVLETMVFMSPESVETIERMITGAGFVPRQRNSWYGLVDERHEAGAVGPQNRDEGATHRAWVERDRT